MEIRNEWENEHQPYELNYHKNYGIAWCSDNNRFLKFWGEIKDFIEPEGKILDIGCGPRPPFRSTCIEPLGEDYRQLTDKSWWAFRKLYAQPAEEFIPELEKKFDTVICWNALDHTYDWKKIVENMKRYSKGKIVIGVDFKPPGVGHPGCDIAEFWELMKGFEILKRKDNFSERDVCLVIK
jgi:hypothetical protein